MLGIDWLTRNAARRNFLECTIIIQNPAFNPGHPSSSPADLGKEMSVNRIRRDDCAKLNTSRVVLPSVSSPISKEVLFHVFDKICNSARNNDTIKQLFNNFIRYLIKGVYARQRNGKHSELVSEHGDLIRGILTGNRFVDQPERNTDSRYEDIFSERGDLALIDNDSDVFKSSDLFNENGEIYDDTL